MGQIRERILKIFGFISIGCWNVCGTFVECLSFTVLTLLDHEGGVHQTGVRAENGKQIVHTSLQSIAGAENLCSLMHVFRRGH